MPTKAIIALRKKELSLNWREVLKDDSARDHRSRCEASASLWERYINTLEEAAPNLEQLKGIVKGLEMSMEIVGQHKTIARGLVDSNEITVEDAKDRIRLISACQVSLKESIDKLRKDLHISVGKVQGISEGANFVLSEIEQQVNHWKHHSLDDLHPDAEPDFLADEPSAPAPAKGNGSTGTVVSHVKVGSKPDKQLVDRNLEGNASPQPVPSNDPTKDVSDDDPDIRELDTLADQQDPITADQRARDKAARRQKALEG